ncbi:MAG: phosphatase PAP2 family protein [Deltaproteobacteria bacterium]
MDIALLRALNGLRTPALDAVSGALNAWGFYLLPFLAVLAAVIRREREVVTRAREVVLAWYVGLTCAEDVLKAVIHRPRPTAVPALRAALHVLGRVPSASSHAFPSGTATAMFAASTAIWLAFGRRAGIAATVFATLVSATRVYAGVHYPSDLVGGACVGAGVAWLLHRLSRWLDDGRTSAVPRPTPRTDA